MPEGEVVPVSPAKTGSKLQPSLPDSPVPSLPPGTPIDTPRPKHRRDRSRKVPGSTSTSTQSPDLYSDTDVYCFASSG